MFARRRLFEHCESCDVELDPNEDTYTLVFCCRACYEIWLTRIKEED